MSEREASWLGPSAQAWEGVMGAGTFPYAKAGRFLAPLYRANWEPSVIGERLGYYLRDLRRRGEVKYLSLPRFVETFNEWDPRELAFDE